MLTVCVDGYVAQPESTKLPLFFSLWDAPMLAVSVSGFPLEDEDTCLPLAFSLWTASPAFSGWSIGADGRLVYSPGGYFRWLGI